MLKDEIWFSADKFNFLPIFQLYSTHFDGVFRYSTVSMLFLQYLIV